MAIDTREIGDRSCAEALRIAEAHLIRLGWRFGPDDVGRVAREILDGLNSNPKDTSNAGK